MEQTPHGRRLKSYFQFWVCSLSCVLLLVDFRPIRAQSNSEYNFRQQLVDDGSRFNTTDPQVDLSMDCLAANGYGQWSMSSAAGLNAPPYTTGWFLLENALRKLSTSYNATDLPHHPDCIPPGIVANGLFSTGPIEPKVAVNLHGGVYYAFLTGTSRSQFIVNGMAYLDISASGVPNPGSTRNVATSGVVPWTISTSDGINNHNVFSEADVRDDFDIAAEGNFSTWRGLQTLIHRSRATRRFGPRLSI